MDSVGEENDERITGKRLAEEWGVDVQHALYHVDGTFYGTLTAFPGALFDPYGYVVFRSDEAYRTSPYLQIGVRVNVRGGISQIPGYKRMRE